MLGRSKIKQYIMRKLIAILSTGMLVFSAGVTNAQSGPVARFHKVIISPYIQVTFVEGDRESVTINHTIADSNKLHVEVHGGTLRLYLDGAKDIPHNQQYYSSDGNQQSHHLYPDHAVIATVVYRKLDAVCLRGEETSVFQSPLSADKFTLRVYGESTVIVAEAHIANMHTTIYGESSLVIKAGEVNRQYYTCYGEGKINTTAIAGQAAKVTAFGEAEFRVNVTDRIRIIAFGEAKLRYMGNPTIVKGIHIGEVDLQRLD
jgi:Putative auto-transporter adhesin, head GIN domain